MKALLIGGLYFLVSGACFALQPLPSSVSFLKDIDLDFDKGGIALPAEQRAKLLAYISEIEQCSTEVVIVLATATKPPPELSDEPSSKNLREAYLLEILRRHGFKHIFFARPDNPKPYDVSPVTLQFVGRCIKW